MKNIKIVKSNQVESFLLELWSTPLFVNFQKKNGSYLNELAKELAKGPLFFYEMSDPYLEKNHLSSMFKHIAFRQYDNPYIQDLYYFHELTHIANLKYGMSTFQEWKEKISNNELFASLVSEVFVYFFEPELRGKTFNNLWADRFFLNTPPGETNLNIPLVDDVTDITWYENYKNNNVDLFSVNISNWPIKFQEIIEKRQLLRVTQYSEDVEEAWIIKFNNLREKWLDMWEPYYIIFENLMIELDEAIGDNEDLAIEKFTEGLKMYSNENYTPFWQIPLKMKKKSPV